MPVLDHGGDAAAAPLRDNPLLASIPRWRPILFTLVGLFLFFAFNGQWRIGRDSAAYRGIGHQLAVTGKYVFRDKHDVINVSDQQDIRYPGMPVVLAGIEKVFGRSDLPAVLFVTLSAIATLFLTYYLTKPFLPFWLVIGVTFGVGINGRFLEHANEILSDIPFLLGVVIALISFDRLVKLTTARSRACALATLVGGLVFAAAMRPTFWMLAVALAATSIWGLFRPTHAQEKNQDPRPRRIACILTLSLLLLAAVVYFAFVDVRGRTSASYEGRMFGRLVDFHHKVLPQLPANAYAIFEQTLPEAFFGTQLGPGFIPMGGKYWIGFSTLCSLAVLVSGVFLVRRNVLWGLYVLLTVIAMAMIGSVPRYFLMVLPLLLAGWGLHVAWLSDRFKKVYGLRETLTFVGLGLVVGPNLVSCLNVVREQRGLSRPRDGFHYVGFSKAYHVGKWDGVDDVADMIRDHVKPNEQVFGPEATVLTFMSDRKVFGLGMFLPRKDRGGKWETIMRKIKPEFPYAVFPDTANKLYNDKDVITGRLIHMGFLRPTRTVAKAAGYKLCEYEIVLPEKKKSTRHHRRDLAASTQPKRRHRPPATSAAPATQAATAPTRRRGRRPRRAPTTLPATTAPLPKSNPK